MHPVLLYGGFTVSFGPMLVKTWRVSKIIKWSVTKARPVSVGSLVRYKIKASLKDST